MSAAKHTPGPWMVATSNSWRRIVSAHRTESVCEPIKQNDGHPDLYFRNGGADGPDARLIAAAPELLGALWKLRNELSALHLEVICDGLGRTNAECLELRVREADKAIAKATGEQP